MALSTSADERVVHVQGHGGGCGDDPRATVTETATTVTIRVQQRLSGDAACPAMARIDNLRVRLSVAADGRALIGQTPPRWPRSGSMARPRVPRRRRACAPRTPASPFVPRASGWRGVRARHGALSGGRRTVTATLARPNSPSLPPLGARSPSALSRKAGSAARSPKRTVPRIRTRGGAGARSGCDLTAGGVPDRKLPRIDRSARCCYS